MRLTLSKALALALVAWLLPGCDRTATDAEEAASKGGTAKQTPSEGSTNDRKNKP
jgi:hypothetical protein